uniref:Uncharacterized protein n=1 Tax=Romanomermis culicivorax TaxID=13658 RepID=A0A915I794_ROMCU
MRCKIHNVDQGYTMGFQRTKDDHFIFQLWYHTEDDIEMVTYESVKTNDCDVLCLKFYNVTNYESMNKAIKFKAAIEQLFCDRRYSNQDVDNCYNSRSDSFSCTDDRFPISLNVGSVFTSTAFNGIVSVVPKDPEYNLYRRMLATNPLNYILRCNMGNGNEDYTVAFERTRDNYFIFQLWYQGKDQIEKLFYSKNKTQE